MAGGSPRLVGRSEQAACDQESASGTNNGADSESKKFYASQYRTFYELEALRSSASLKTFAEKRHTLAQLTLPGKQRDQQAASQKSFQTQSKAPKKFFSNPKRKVVFLREGIQREGGNRPQTGGQELIVVDLKGEDGQPRVKVGASGHPGEASGIKRPKPQA